MVTNLNDYYRQTADRYDEMHVADKDEHFIALERTLLLLEPLGIRSILDVGCGTGRALTWYRQRMSDVGLFGVDPSPELLHKAAQAVPSAEFSVGTGEQLPFPSEYVDLVVATGIMHHVDRPSQCIREMFRVARKAVLSDHNNFAFGGPVFRRLRLALFAFSLQHVATFAKQGFKRQGYSEDDGWWYPYSLLNDFKLISELSEQVFILPTRPTNSRELTNFLLCQSHMAILANKQFP